MALMLQDLGIIDLWTFLAGALVIILLPGPNSLYVLRTGMGRGIKAASKAIAGVMAGDLILIFLAWAGVATLIRTSPHIFMMVRYLGAMFLLYLGIKIIMGALRQRADTQPAEPVKAENYFLRAVLLGVTNPKAILFYVSFFIQFIDPKVTHTAPAFATLGALIQLISFSYYSVLLVAGAVMVRFLRSRTRLVKFANMLTGMLFFGFAVRLVSAQS
jgi:leucine efflux protein